MAGEVEVSVTPETSSANDAIGVIAICQEQVNQLEGRLVTRLDQEQAATNQALSEVTAAVTQLQETAQYLSGQISQTQTIAVEAVQEVEAAIEELQPGTEASKVVEVVPDHPPIASEQPEQPTRKRWSLFG